MSSEDWDRRFSRLEEESDRVSRSLAELHTTVALLGQSFDAMAKVQEKRQATVDKVLMIALGVVVSAGVTWVLRGGLA